LKLLSLATALIIPLGLAGCTSASAQEMAMPDFVQGAPTRVKDAYRYALSHPDDLAAMPCYCGCDGMGHTSNLSCFISGYSKEGTPIYEPHASGCGICVDIAQDVMRLRSEGKSLKDIRATIDATYSSFGPGTDTPLPSN
jgi:uncharacterized protein with PCYCGC motif